MGMPPHQPMNSKFSQIKPVIAKALGKEGGSVFLIILVALGFYAFVYLGMRFFLVPSASMEPLLYPNDYIVTLKQKQYTRGDVVVVRDNREGGYLVKRLIAKGGDTVRLEFGATYINGSYISEPYIAEPMQYGMDMPLRVPDGEVFVLGDNRNHSMDSGMTRETWPEELIVGKVVFRYFPYDQFGRIFSFPIRILNVR